MYTWTCISVSYFNKMNISDSSVTFVAIKLGRVWLCWLSSVLCGFSYNNYTLQTWIYPSWISCCTEYTVTFSIMETTLSPQLCVSLLANLHEHSHDHQLTGSWACMLFRVRRDCGNKMCKRAAGIIKFDLEWFSIGIKL